jgi:hypothetical protein
MNAHQVIEALVAIAELGKFPFEPGEGFGFSLVLSNGTEVGLEIDPTVDALLLSADLYQVPEEKKVDIFDWAMRMNHLNSGTAGATLGWDSNSRFLVLSAILPLQLLDEAGFLSALDAFAAKARDLGVAPPYFDDQSSVDERDFPLVKA